MTCFDRTTQLHVPRRNQRGFTLIEVLMAAFVMAIGVLGLTALFAGAARQQQLSSQTTRSVAVTRSADAFITERFGTIERADGQATLERGDIPPNNQGNLTEIENDQWYVIPRAADGSLSLNPRESTAGWIDRSLCTRAQPREPLPKLLFRARMERRNNAVVRTGLPGSGANGIGLGEPLVFNSPLGAPPFDGGIRELRAIPDSFTVRIVTRAFPCQGTQLRSLESPDDREVILRGTGGNWNDTEFTLEDEATVKSRMMIRIDAESKDAELLTTNSPSEFFEAHVASVLETSSNDPNCSTGSTLFAQTIDPAFGGPTMYVWRVDDPVDGNVQELIRPYNETGYDLQEQTVNGVRVLGAVLRAVDVHEPNLSMFKDGFSSGDFVLSSDGITAPAGSSATMPYAEVRPAAIPDRFIHEIWLDDYAYRGHTLASLPETVAYGAAAERGTAPTPQLGYSMLFRRTSGSAVQYALVSYAIAPTYSPSADRADNSDDDFFPEEDAGAVEYERAPLRLVKNIEVEYDDAIGQYYIEYVDPKFSWVATPGQILLFNGDASATPPIPGADAPVTVVNVRRMSSGAVRAYLDGPPRAGLQSLTDLGNSDRYDAWAVAPSCYVKQRVPTGKSTPLYSWGLRPVGARVFTISK